ncbi:hypothetical protein LY76DRAFT_230508 [Colletotrichum caudatum]|nr:hypothetical protein LY76DRAFT_230508 [Colletotrichum caudatum]
MASGGFLRRWNSHYSGHFGLPHRPEAYIVGSDLTVSHIENSSRFTLCFPSRKVALRHMPSLSYSYTTKRLPNLAVLINNHPLVTVAEMWRSIHVKWRCGCATCRRAD